MMEVLKEIIRLEDENKWIANVYNTMTEKEKNMMDIGGRTSEDYLLMRYHENESKIAYLRKTL